jgi:hypothetical protein
VNDQFQFATSVTHHYFSAIELQHALLAHYNVVAENHNVHMIFPTSYYWTGKPNEMRPIESALKLIS